MLYLKIEQMYGKMKTTRKGGAYMQNMDIRLAANSAGVRLWQIAEALGLADCNFSRKLRRELPTAEKEKILGIIEKLSVEGET